MLSTIAAPARVKQLEKALKELEEGKVEIQLPAEIVPKLIGKKGETINQLMEDTGCLVDIDKVTNAVRLCGTKESVGMAKKFIYELIEDQSQREREFSVHDTVVFPSPDYAAFKFGFFAEFLMSNKAQQLKLLRTDASDAKIKVLKEEQKIHVIGNKAQLKAMEEALRERLREFEAHHWLHEVSDNYVLSLIIGKKGAKIKQIEEEGKEAHVKVDIQGTHVCVFGDTPAGIEHARATILEVVEQNQRSVYHTSQHLIAILLNNKRAKLSEIETSSGCKLNLPPPPASGEAKGKTDTSDKQAKITLTGTLEAISDAKTQLEQLDEAHHVRYWPLDDDEVATVIGSKGATISDLESKSGAKLRVLRDGSNAELEMLGTQEQLTAVQKALDELLQTKNRELLQLDPFATGCVIGKKGDRIKTIREAHPDASVDAFPNRGQVRIKAANPESLRACVEHVLKLLRETQVVESVKLPTGSTAGSFTAILEKYPAIAMRLQELEAEGGENMKVTYQEDGRVAKLRGPALGIGALKKFLEMLVDPESHFVETIKVPTYAFASVLLTKGSDGAIDANKLNENALRICKHTGCEIRVKKLTGTGRKDEQENPEGVIRIEGTNPAKVYEAKDQVEKVLQFYHSECIQALDKLPQSVVPRLYELLPTLTAKHRVVFSLPNATTIKVFTDAKATTRDVVAQLKKELEVWKKQHVEMPIPGWLVPVLVGKNGENIKKLGVESQNARLELSQSTGASGGKFAAQEERVLTISAREDAVIQLAVQNVKAFIQLHENRTSTVDVAKNKMDLVISAKKDAPSGVQVHIVHNAKNAETVQVVVYGGEHEDREALVEKIEHLISTSVIETITLPPNASNSVVGALIGKSGANIRALQKEFPRVMIDIKREANTISLKGPTDDVLQVKSVMEDKVQELLRQQEEYEQRTRQIEEEKRAQQQQYRAKPASVDGESDENAEPNQTKVSPPVVARTGPVGGSASMNQPKLNKNQRRRIRKRAENEKKSDVLSMIMGGESTTTTETETSVESSSHYHSSSGYSLRL
ncbi:TPA: hypothetical protein N0F65_011944 [Lagenidium giganteum]|uniref:K Homology domain-containing protein n=1 Tax=Lagenidium giganteum TaxID=4803 RepID=A0AAV2Z782_9STRA|nr:TPA: hypothetical protein N0F65_011944 [Lagenidium giganteum]